MWCLFNMQINLPHQYTHHTITHLNTVRSLLHEHANYLLRSLVDCRRSVRVVDVVLCNKRNVSFCLPCTVSMTHLLLAFPELIVYKWHLSAFLNIHPFARPVLASLPQGHHQISKAWQAMLPETQAILMRMDGTKGTSVQLCIRVQSFDWSIATGTLWAFRGGCVGNAPPTTVTWEADAIFVLNFCFWPCVEHKSIGKPSSTVSLVGSAICEAQDEAISLFSQAI